MKKEIRAEKKNNHSVRGKWKRVLAMLLSVLMVTSVIDYSGFINVSAETIDGEASVTDSAGVVTIYNTVEAAITAAQGISSSTVTLLKGVTTESAVIVNSGTFTIDLHGMTWVGPADDIALRFTYSPNVTIEDSIGGGEITSTYSYVVAVYSISATVTLQGGKYKGIGNVASGGTIGALLVEGYAYKNSDGTWVSDVSGWKITDVTVQEAPVKITAQPEDVAAYTESPTLNVTAVKVPADSGKDITYQWYSVGTGSGGTNEAISGATSASYAFPTATSAAGSYTYYCAVTCDGYTVNTRGATVEYMPVKITAQPEDVAAYTESPTLNVTAVKVPADSGKDITYQWYSVGTGSGGTNEAISGATSASYAFPTATSAAGSYTYYCAVTCDGYIVNTREVVIYVSVNNGNFEVISSDGTISLKCASLEAAIAVAKGMSGSTVQLLADATTASRVEVTSGTFTIDLNGHTWTSNASDYALYLTNGSHVTLKDSASGGKFTSASYGTIYAEDAWLTIESGNYENTNTGTSKATLLADSSSVSVSNKPLVTIKDGTFTSQNMNSAAYFSRINVSISGGIFSNMQGGSVSFTGCPSVSLTGGTYRDIIIDSGNVSTLLANGYGYKTVSQDTWVNDTSDTTPTNVTVQPVPAKITTQPQNAANAIYGYATAPTMSVTAETTAAAPAGSNISYQWYRIKSETEASDTAVGINSSTLTIPTGLNAGTHSFYCVVSCDGYIIKSNAAAVTVNKAAGSISNKETGGYATEHTYTGNSIAEPLPDEFTTNSGGAVTFTWYSGDSTADGDRLTTAPSEIGTYTLKAEVAGTDNYNAENTTVKVNISYWDTPLEAILSGTQGGNDWYTSDVTVAAPENYCIAVSNGSEAVWGGSLTVNTDMNGAYTYYLKQISTGYITDAKTVTVKRDATAPEIGTITYSDHQSFLDWLFHRDRIDVTVPASDTLSGADHISYVLTPDGSEAQTSENGTPQAQTANVDANGDAVFTVEKDFKGTIIVTAYDKAGNVSAQKKIAKMVVEDTAPTLTVNDGSNDFTSDWYASGQTLHISAADAGSGIQSVTCAVDDEATQTLFAKADTDSGLTVGKDGLTVTAQEGTHTYTITVTDNAFNTSVKTVTIHQDTVAPELSYVISAASSRVTDTTATLKVTTSEAGSLYYMAKESGTAPTLEDLFATEAHDMTAGNQSTISLDGLKRNTAYTIYVAAKDEAGNQTVAMKELMLETAKTSLTGAEVTLRKDGNILDKSYIYDGTSQIPDISVSIGTTTLDASQYDISYSNSNGGSGNTTDAGTVTVTVTAKDDSDYTKTATATYVIAKRPVTLTAANATKQYGQANPPLALEPITAGQLVGNDTVADLNITLSTTAGTASEAGNYPITGTGSNANYEVTVSGTLTITKIDAALTVAATAITRTYGDKAFSVGAATAGMAALSYQSSNTSIAMVNSVGTVTIRGCGIVTITVSAAGTSYNTVAKTVTLTVKPKTMGTPSLKSAQSKKLTVTWKKDSKVSGYQIAYSTSSKFTAKTTKTVTVTSYKKLTKTIGKLKSGQKYYAHIRSYRSSGKSIVYSSWSKTVKKKVK